MPEWVILITWDTMDWIKTGWGIDMQQSFDEKLQFVMDFANAIYSDRPPLEIAIEVIHGIAKKYPPPYNLMISGGVDSQAMVWAWLQTGIPFTAISFQYVDHQGIVVNDDDLVTMKTFALEHQINIEYKQLPIHEFLNTELEQYVHKYQCTSPQICAHMKMADIVGTGTIIYSGNFIYPNFVPLNYTIYGLARFAQRSSLHVIPFFFMHDSELANSFLPEIDKLIPPSSAAITAEMVGYLAKCKIYQSCGFPIIPQDEKMTGFERIKEYYDQFPKMVTVKTRLRHASRPSRRVFDLLYRYRWIQDIKYVDTILVLNSTRLK
jgi:hypothetical protein